MKYINKVFTNILINGNQIFIILSVVFIICTNTIYCYAQISKSSQYNITNFKKSDYYAGTQNWKINFIEPGFVLAANNEGLLVFDGTTWKLLETPKKTIVRSFAYDSIHHRIYIGAQSEVGYFEIGEENQYEYNDLTYLLPNLEIVDDVWDLDLINDKLYFQSNNQIFIVTDQLVDIIDPKGTITHMSSIDNAIYFNAIGRGIFKCVDSTCNLFVDNSLIIYEEVSGFIPFENNKILVTSLDGSIFEMHGKEVDLWETACEETLKDQFINSGYYDNEKNNLYLGTFSGGIFEIDTDGNLNRIVNTESGLQSNTITSLDMDHAGNLWCSHYSGIDCIHVNSSKSWLYPDANNQLAVYDITDWNEQTYIATNNGLYFITRNLSGQCKNLQFQKIPGSTGECWGLDVINGQLFLAHDQGGFLITKNNELIQLDLQPGVWKFLPITPEKILVGHYYGISVLKREGNEWEYSHDLEGINESSRILELVNQEELWMTHPYLGVYKFESEDLFETNSSYKFQIDDGLSNLNKCYGFTFQNNFYVSNEDGIFTYYDQKFYKDSIFSSVFDGEILLRVMKYNENHYFITDQWAGKLNQTKIGTQFQIERENLVLNQKSFVGGFENFIVEEDEEIFVLTDFGVKIIQLEKEYILPKVQINSLVLTENDSLIYDRFSSWKIEEIIIPKRMNNIKIQYHSMFNQENPDNYVFRYRLSEEDPWSDWSPAESKNYDYLPFGKYRFQVQAKSSKEVIGEVASLNFIVKPPIYFSWVAIVLYVIIAIGLLYIISFLPYRFQKSKNEVLLQEKSESDTKRKKMEEEYLQMQINMKNKELANTTMHLVQKNQVLSKIKVDIDNIKSSLSDKKVKSELNSLVKLLNEDERLEEDWEDFTKHFNEVHHDFINRLKKDYPNLSSNDLKLCAFLRLNLSTKEIAPLLGISVRGVEVSRYRLRKKLEMDRNENLNEFMIQY